MAGIAGGAGSGKSEVAGLFRRWGGRVVDADRIGHHLLRRGSPCYKKIVRKFGNIVINGNGAVDRRRLGELVFSDPRRRRELDSIVRPDLVRRVKQEITRLKRAGGGPIVLDAALLVDWGLHREMDRTIVVEAPAGARLARLARKGVPVERALGMMAAQTPSGLLRRAADEVIDNSGTRAELRRKARAAWGRLAVPAGGHIAGKQKPKTTRREG